MVFLFDSFSGLTFIHRLVKLKILQTLLGATANRVRFPEGLLPEFCIWESCRTISLVGEFSRGYLISPSPSFWHRSILDSLTVKTSLLKEPPKSLHPLTPNTFVFLRDLSGAEMQGRGKWEIPEKIRRPVVSSGTITTRKNQEATTAPSTNESEGTYEVGVLPEGMHTARGWQNRGLLVHGVLEIVRQVAHITVLEDDPGWLLLRAQPQHPRHSGVTEARQEPCFSRHRCLLPRLTLDPCCHHPPTLRQQPLQASCLAQHHLVPTDTPLGQVPSSLGGHYKKRSSAHVMVNEEIWAARNIKVLRADEGEERLCMKQSQNVRVTTFPHTKIQELSHRESKPVRIGGRQLEAAELKRAEALADRRHHRCRQHRLVARDPLCHRHIGLLLRLVCTPTATVHHCDYDILMLNFPVVFKKKPSETDQRYWGRSGVVVMPLASQLGELVSIPSGVAPGFLHVGIVPDDATRQCVFSGISRSPCPVIQALLLLHIHLASPSSALKTSMLRATRISSLTHIQMSTHFHKNSRTQNQLSYKRQCWYTCPTRITSELCHHLHYCEMIHRRGHEEDSHSRCLEFHLPSTPELWLSGLHCLVTPPELVASKLGVERFGQLLTQIWRAEVGEVRWIWNARVRVKGDPRENPSISTVVQHYSHTRNSGSGSDGNQSCSP
ncbi:hypothetical protein PR048_022281 [Dryococelus australis]|uniref:Uncharacterized protein n=1 Tax=Dryococelus australis TaxID=614101 RepID=A0ABQ9H0V1_9NEOP|nr:hypothetical protein PR048_022281 [Dryococelus australis]